MIIVGGRNVFPEDIERAVGGVDGVRAGNVIAVGVEGYKGKESVVVVAEVRVDGDADSTACAPRVHHRTLDVCGIPPRDVMLVAPGTLPKTSSGKLQRARCKRAVPRRRAVARRKLTIRASPRRGIACTPREMELEASAFQVPFEPRTGPT